MATTSNQGGLTVGLPDPAKINLYGARDEDLAAYQKSLEDSLSALQQRYAQPNWFNVAAGFFKPQLGGFAASLGSASEALGQNVERERESQLPIAQMRSQLAMSKIAMGQNKAAADKFAAWKLSGKPIDEATYSEITALAPNSSAALAAKAAYEGARATLEQKAKQTQNTIAQVQAEMAIIDAQRAAGVLTEDQANQQKANLRARLSEVPNPLMGGPSDTATDKRAGTAGAGTVGAGTVGAGTVGAGTVGAGTVGAGTVGAGTVGAGTVAAGAASAAGVAGAGGEKTGVIPKLVPGPGFDAKDTERAAIYNQEFAKLYPQAIAGTDQRAVNDLAALVREAARLKVFPSTEGLAAGAATPAASVTPPDFKYRPSFTLPHVQAVTAREKAANDAELAKAASSNKKHEQQYLTLADLNDPRSLSVAQNALNEASSALKSRPDLALAVTDQLRRAGSAAAMINKGVGISWNPFGGASINIPVQEGLRASLSPAEKAYQDTLINNLATVAYYGLKARGITPETEGAEKFKELLLQETGITQTPLSISHQLELNKHHLAYGQNLFKAYNEGLPRTQGFLAPHYEVFTQSPQIKFETDLHNRKLKAEQIEYERQLSILRDAEKAAAAKKKGTQ